MKRILTLAVALALWMASAGPAGAAESTSSCSAPVATTEGSYAGFTDKYDSCAWYGIPFAQPPVGALRLRRPEPPAPHQGVRAATEFGPACLQKEDISMGGTAKSYGEDCLYLNVWRPAKSGKFPVMVFFHGGAFMGGSGSFDIYKGSNLAATEELVVVTINYRLGPLGYISLPELAAEDKKGSTGNYGIQDQIRALSWVRDNIAAFGGDPGNVTIFGQSAGGASVSVLMVAPEAAGLFHKAMTMSAPSRLLTAKDEGEKKSRAYAASIGCTGTNLADCLRQRPQSDFLRKAPNDLFNAGMTWTPVIDGAFLTENPVTLIQQGNYRKVPLLIGSTRDELRSYALAVPGLGLWTRGEVSWFLGRLAGPDNAKQLLSMYSYDEFRRPIDLAFAFGAHMVFETPAFLIAEAVSKDVPVYWYRFDWDQTRFPHKIGAMHAIDVPFVFGSMNPDSALVRMMANEAIFKKHGPLAYVMMGYIGAFARGGNPNGASRPEWPAYTSADRNRMLFNSQIKIQKIGEREITRYNWYAERTLQQVLAGPLAKRISNAKDK